MLWGAALAAEQLLQSRGIHGCNFLRAGEAARLLGRLLLEVVTHAGVLAQQLAAAGDLDALLGAAVGLVLRHVLFRPVRLLFGFGRLGVDNLARRAGGLCRLAVW